MLETSDRPAGAQATLYRRFPSWAKPLAAPILVIGVAALILLKDRSPTHQGRTVSEWVHHGFALGATYVTRREAIDALIAMGPAAHAELMKEFTFTYSKNRKRFNNLKKKHPVLGLPAPPESERRFSAQQAICALKEHAAPMIDELAVHIASNKKSYRAYFALASIGTPDAAKLLIDTLQSNGQRERRFALMALNNLPAQLAGSPEFTRTATPILIDVLKNGDADFRDSAAHNLSRVAITASDEVAEALSQSGPLIHSPPKASLQSGIVRCLLVYGEKAKIAAPLLISAIQEIDAALAPNFDPQNPPRLKGVFPPRLKGWRSPILQALQSVDPEAAAPYAPAKTLTLPEDSETPVGNAILRITLPPVPSAK